VKTNVFFESDNSIPEKQEILKKQKNHGKRGGRNAIGYKLICVSLSLNKD
jgi:hypothetical protein